MDNAPSVFEWFEQHEGRGSERSRRLSFLILFTREGKPSFWLVLLALAAATVAGAALGGFY